MKTLKTLSALVLAAGLIFTSCKKKDSTPDPTATPNDPTINFIGGNGYISSDYTVTAGSTIKVGYNANYNSTSKSYLSRVYRSTTSNNLIVDSLTTNFTSSSNTQSFNDSIVRVAPSVTVATVYHFQVTVTDKAGLSANISLNVTVIPAPPTVAVIGATSGTTNFTLGGKNDVNGSYFNINPGTVLTSTMVTTTTAPYIDLVYNQSHMYSPSDAAETNTTVKGAGIITKLDIYTAKAYASITAADINAYTPSGSTNVTVGANSVIMFLNAAGKKGVLQVTSFNGTTSTTSTTDHLTITGQVQQ